MLIKRVALSDVDPDPNQPRQDIDPAELKELKDSIASAGLILPIIVYLVGARFRVVDGHRRLAALQGLGQIEANAIILETKPSDRELARMQLTANCFRSGLKPSELAFAIKGLIDAEGFNRTQAADFLGMSKSKVTRLLSYLTLPPEAIAKIDSGELTGRAAYAIAREGDSQVRERLLHEALTGDSPQPNTSEPRSSPKASKPKTVRRVFRLPIGDIIVSSSSELSLEDIGLLCKTLTRRLRTASRECLDVPTLERVLNAQAIHPENAEHKPADS